MANLELVEKLRERAKVTYDEAKEALEACGDDLLEAVIYLEKKGKVPPPENGGVYDSRQGPKDKNDGYTYTYTADSGSKTEGFGEMMGRFFKWCGGVVQKSCVNTFQVRRGDQVWVTIPVLALVLLIIFCFWVSIPLLIVGMFFGCRYSFHGPETEKMGLNSVMDSAANAADNIKSEIMGGGEPKS